jgi:hypothetical protein
MAQPTPPARGSGRGSRGEHDTDPTLGPSPAGRDRPATLGRGAPVHAPFAWQHGSRLFLLEGQAGGWVLAEMRFDTRGCRYVELRRAHYRWPREAIGALLGRAMVAGDAAAADLAGDLAAWVAAHEGGR